MVRDRLAEGWVADHRGDLLDGGAGVGELVADPLHRSPSNHAVPTWFSMSQPALSLAAIRDSILPPISGTLAFASPSKVSSVPSPSATSRRVPVIPAGLPGVVTEKSAVVGSDQDSAWMAWVVSQVGRASWWGRGGQYV